MEFDSVQWDGMGWDMRAVAVRDAANQNFLCQPPFSCSVVMMSCPVIRCHILHGCGVR